MKAFYPGVGHRAQVALPLAFAAAMALSLLSLGLLHDQFPAVMGLAILTVPCFFLPELGLALFMLSGRFNLPLPEGFHEGPEMMTELSLVLVAPLVMVSLARFLASTEKWRILRLFAPFALLGFLVFLRGSGSPGDTYTTEKLMRFGLVTLPGIFAALCIVRDPDSLKRFLWSIFAVGLALGALGLPSLLRAHELLRVSALGGNPINFARNLGLSFLVALVFLPRSRFKPLLVGAMALAGLLVLASGSRAPGLGLFAITLLVLLANCWRMRGPRKMALVLLVAPAAFYIFANFYDLLSRLPMGSVGRYMLMREGLSVSSPARLTLLDAAWSGFRMNPWGWGTGSFAAMSPISFFRYPHNLLLEIAVELGLVGLVLALLVVLRAGFVSLKQVFSRGENSIPVAVVSVLFLFMLANAMFSGDINSNLSLWMLAALAMKFGGKSK